LTIDFLDPNNSYKMKYIVVDASLSGTGLRDKYEGGYLSPDALGLSFKTIEILNQWLSKYENEHYNGFTNESLIDKLDKEGKEIALLIKDELSDVKLEYFSDARMTNEIL
jgi:hypothetical protein